MLSSQLDASALFKEAKDGEEEFRVRTREVYQDIVGMTALEDGRIKLKPCVPGILEKPAEHMRLVWHFAGSCGVRLLALFLHAFLSTNQIHAPRFHFHRKAGRVVHPNDFSVMGTRGLYVADVSTCLAPPDGGTMAMAYLTGHLTASTMMS